MSSPEEVVRRLEEVETELLERVLSVLEEVGNTLVMVVSLLVLEGEEIESAVVVSEHVYQVPPWIVVVVVRTPKAVAEENAMEL